MKKKLSPRVVFFLIIFIIIVIGFYNYSKRLNTAYKCIDRNNKIYFLFFSHPDYHNISGANNNWIKDGISNYEMMDWVRELKKEKGNEIRYYSRLVSKINEKQIFHKIITDKGKEYSLPINNYRTVIFDKKEGNYRIYEYENFRFQTEEFLLNNIFDKNFKIKMKIKNELECSEDKGLYKQWSNISF